MSDPISSVIQNPSPLTTQEPIQSEMPPPQAPMCGFEGASTAGTEALVRRFAQPSGSGGAPGASSMDGSDCGDVSIPDRGSCGNETLRAIGSCGSAALVAAGTGGLAAIFSGAVCAVNVAELLECIAKEEP